jgi:predicted RNA binding protein YcfA (HicA-like mRNA interferase family)
MSQHLPVLRAREVIRSFEKAGFQIVPKRGKGSHTVMSHPTKTAILTIPDHDPVKRGTLRSLIRDAEMTMAQFRELL